jgi:large subunit ribosomal protein L22
MATDIFQAKLRNVRVAPRKARLVVDLVRGKRVSDALDTLRFMNKKMAPVVHKLIRSAMVNATSQATVDVDRLYVKEIYVDHGEALKRFLPRAQGRATPVRKSFSHITVKITEI